ncbi:hypothetical protein [Microbacterium sp. che218]|uniref:hypothetical protein n=1 Tax=Microbacterium sp. che218 TaxID=3140649 RepID=UPI003368404D
MQDLLSLLNEALLHTPVMAALFVAHRALINLRTREFVTDVIDRMRLASTLGRLEKLGASKKELRKVLRADHAARVGRSP